ncbi:MAG: hypothetical protein KF819_22640 [Labilithrix sp.]|nr:hypothetical protein [Labilithrix sp.]
MTDVAEDVTVVWVSEDGTPRASAGEGRDDAVRALAEWGRARGVKLVSAAEGGPGALRFDPSLAERVEKELDRAREAIAALDADTADRALARAEAVLREHPELPQAAWLRAEVLRGWSNRWTRIEPRDEARARAAWQDADALDGGRVAGVGEAAAEARPKVAFDIVVQGGARRIVVRLDGVEIAGKPASDGASLHPALAAPTEHQLTVSRDGEPIFATWLSIGAPAPGAQRLVVPIVVGGGASCSAATFANVKVDSDDVGAKGVSCDRWILAMPAPRRGAVRVARCDRESCGPLLEWRVESAADMGPPLGPPKRPTGMPAWATWTLLGVGAAAATTITLVATGVFDARTVEPRFVNGGVRTD